MSYFAIYTSEDGDVTISEFTKEELERNLNEKAWGEDIQMLAKTGGKLKGLDLRNLAGLLIIKGEIILPKPQEVVTKYGVD